MYSTTPRRVGIAFDCVTNANTPTVLGSVRVFTEDSGILWGTDKAVLMKVKNILAGPVI
jgi:hypothetical protein